MLRLSKFATVFVVIVARLFDCVAAFFFQWHMSCAVFSLTYAVVTWEIKISAFVNVRLN